MKKIIIVAFLTSMMVFNLSAIHEKYTKGYAMLPSVVNTQKNETAMSFYKDKVVYSIIDSSGNIKLYSAAINDTIIELRDVQEEKEMTELGIYGTFGSDESQNKIYFSRYNKGTKNYMLYESTLSDKNQWSKPKKLKIDGLSGYLKTGSATVNAGWLYRVPGFSGFFNPTLAKNGTRIYFSGDFSQGKGDRDIWYIDLAGKNKWSMPQNVGGTVNTKSKEDYPFVVGDSLLYFATTNDTQGDFDLSVARIVNNEWQSEELDPIYNSPTDDYNIIGTDKVLFFISGRNTGNGDDIYRPSQLDLGELTLLPEPRPEREPTVLMKTFPWKLFYFDFDKDILTQEFEEELDELFITMQDYMADNDFVIRGHTDERGSNAYNDRLSLRRATRVYQMLIQRGMPADKMKIEAYGETQLIIQNATTEEEHAQNRRVEVDIVRPDEPAQIEIPQEDQMIEIVEEQ